MAEHNDLGKSGEALAKEFYEQKGFLIIELNWRYSYYEVDLIAAKNKRLHFVEVKTRRSDSFIFPEESVSKKKLNFLKRAAEQYLYKFPQWKNIQFDILSIIIGNTESKFFLIEDVF